MPWSLWRESCVPKALMQRTLPALSEASLVRSRGSKGNSTPLSRGQCDCKHSTHEKHLLHDHGNVQLCIARYFVIILNRAMPEDGTRYVPIDGIQVVTGDKAYRGRHVTQTTASGRACPSTYPESYRYPTQRSSCSGSQEILQKLLR